MLYVPFDRVESVVSQLTEPLDNTHDLTQQTPQIYKHFSK